ncbi:hypothetical protein T11_6113 [Trichinella zimbabwensis]|uniref:Uncharacterized protein n=1 Tax=Trichinella zimbabwensis TaxID=268475 RepID=A0A0V1I2E7_9BILA|nr:hypothetical protein T11_6113 [Trichinella zimbabwensis]
MNGVHHSSLAGSNSRSDRLDLATFPCAVFTFADREMPSSLEWISIILPMEYLTHAVPDSWINTMSRSFGSCCVLCHLPRVFSVLCRQTLLISPSSYHVVGPACFLGAPACFRRHIRQGIYSKDRARCASGISLIKYGQVPIRYWRAWCVISDCCYVLM